jgi:hypothetical protein
LIPVPGSGLNPRNTINNPGTTPNVALATQSSPSASAVSFVPPRQSAALPKGVPVSTAVGGNSRGGVQVAAASGVLPISGWRKFGAVSSAPVGLAQSAPPQRAAPGQQLSAVPQADPLQAQVTRPQDVEQPRQVILEWSR